MMGKNIVETVMGGVVLLVAAGFLFIALNTAQVKSVEGYTVEAAFLKIGGLQKGSDVRMNGIKIGTVQESRLDPETYDAVVAMSIRPDLKLPADTVASVVSGGLIGGKYVRLEPGADRENFVAAGGRLENTKDFKSLEDQVGEIIFLATGGEDQ
ncbi:outer membrane lipid asymmetry maintenance protein MlaD [Terasakiella sp. SH-1]|uniref:outer membrane lipid asymmetry maintenance protein MlaD n=1 Tax=Terasakiella sp. SH-1 TaxID=2560057 RepID=UPI0032099416